MNAASLLFLFPCHPSQGLFLDGVTSNLPSSSFSLLSVESVCTHVVNILFKGFCALVTQLRVVTESMLTYWSWIWKYFLCLFRNSLLTFGVEHQGEMSFQICMVLFFLFYSCLAKTWFNSNILNVTVLLYSYRNSNWLSYKILIFTLIFQRFKNIDIGYIIKIKCN